MRGGVNRVAAPAKINLFLGVGARRPDGYHDVTTVIHALEFGDEVSVVPASTLRFSCDPLPGVSVEANLAYRAVLAAAEAFECEPLVEVSITKHIPHAAGLGGASSDAGAVLRALASMWGLSPSEPRLVDVARSLGADVPFFLAPGAALYTGRGDVLSATLPPLSLPIVLAMPEQRCPTSEVYAAFDAGKQLPPEAPDELVSALGRGDAAAVAALLRNNLAAAALTVAPAMGDLLGVVRRSPGVLGTVVCGSGSAIAGVCATMDAATKAAETVRAAGSWSTVTRTVASPHELGDGK